MGGISVGGPQQLATAGCPGRAPRGRGARCRGRPWRPRGGRWSRPYPAPRPPARPAPPRRRWVASSSAAQRPGQQRQDDPDGAHGLAVVGHRERLADPLEAGHADVHDDRGRLPVVLVARDPERVAQGQGRTGSRRRAASGDASRSRPPTRSAARRSRSGSVGMGYARAVAPPSTGTTAPVMNEASSESRNATTAAISCAVPARPSTAYDSNSRLRGGRVRCGGDGVLVPGRPDGARLRPRSRGCPPGRTPRRGCA